MESAKDPDLPQSQSEPEAFIPYLMDDLVEMCFEDGKLSESDQEAFRQFSEFFAVTNNFLSHCEMEALDKDYAYFNPDSEVKIRSCGDKEMQDAENRVVEAFRTAAKNANYRRLTDAEIEASFESQSLIKLRTAVDLEEFDHVECFVRGGDIRTVQRKNWKLQEVDEQIEIWRRVLLLMEFKRDEELTPEQLKRRQKEKMPYQPGKIYIYQYKEVPKPDLEILFPNVRVSMNLKDRILLGVPALAAAIGTALKVGLKIAFVAGVIIWAIFGKEAFGFDSDNADKDDLYKVAVAFLGILVAFGGLAFKQYTSFKNKRISFLKEVSEHLFFRNIAMNKAVFDRIIDDGEDEDCKEAALVYYHLLTNPDTPMNRKMLDETIQDWMKERFDTTIDFDIDGPVEKLKKIKGVTNAGKKRALLSEDLNGILRAPSLAEAKEILDHHWDNAFQYSHSDKTESIVT